VNALSISLLFMLLGELGCSAAQLAEWRAAGDVV